VIAIAAEGRRFHFGGCISVRKSLLATAALVSLSGSALAADLPNAKGPPGPPPVPVFTWTGFYIGGRAGYQWGQSVQNLVAEPGSVFVSTEPNTDTEGIVGGAHIGYNWQVSQIVLGIEGDVEGTGYSGSELSNSGAFSNSTNIAIEGSARARVGFAWDQFLFYGTGGAAFASIRNSVLTVGGGPSDQATIGRVG
jgi:outer membrane immunogenic protein